MALQDHSGHFAMSAEDGKAMDVYIQDQQGGPYRKFTFVKRVEGPHPTMIECYGSDGNLVYFKEYVRWANPNAPTWSNSLEYEVFRRSLPQAPDEVKATSRDGRHQTPGEILVWLWYEKEYVKYTLRRWAFGSTGQQGYYIVCSQFDRTEEVDYGVHILWDTLPSPREVSRTRQNAVPMDDDVSSAPHGSETSHGNEEYLGSGESPQHVSGRGVRPTDKSGR